MPSITPPNAAVELILCENSVELALPLLSSSISAGFPSPALDFIDLKIDLNTHLIKHPSATFFGRVKGYSMKDAGIGDDDLIIIDKSIPPSNGKIAVCYLDGEFTLKQIKIIDKEIWLMPANSAYKGIKMEAFHHLVVWGVVTYVIKKIPCSL